MIEDAQESLRAREAFEAAQGAVIRWIDAAMPDESSREALAKALRLGGQLRVEIVLPAGTAKVWFEMNKTKRMFFEIRHDEHELN